MRLIDADALIEVLNDNGVPYNADANYFIEHAPSIDIVHCRECKWADWYKAIDGNCYCYCMITGASARTDNDFCSYGEREGE